MFLIQSIKYFITVDNSKRNKGGDNMKEQKNILINPKHITTYVPHVNIDNVFLKIDRTLLMKAKESKQNNISFNINSYTVYRNDARKIDIEDQFDKYNEDITFQVKVNDPKSLAIKAIIASNFSNAISKRGLAKKDIAKQLGISRPALSMILNGEISLALENLHILKEYFDIPKSELLQGVDLIKISPPIVTKKEKKLGSLLKSLKKTTDFSSLINMLKIVKTISSKPKTKIDSLNSVLKEINNIIDNEDDLVDLKELLKTINKKNIDDSKNKLEEIRQKIKKM
jgi:transcriptional regulator with XRE-family HTH domain